MADGYCKTSLTKKKLQDPRLAKLSNSESLLPKKIIVNKDFFRNPWLESSNNMYNNPNQYSGQGYQSSYPAYQQNYTTAYNYEGYGQQSYLSTTVQPVPPGEEYPQNAWAPISGYVHQSQQQQQQQQQHHSNNVLQRSSREDEGVAQERKHHHAQLVKQREEYVRKVSVLRRELELLRNQKQEILSENSSQRDMEPILKENDKLQDEIQSKMKAIYNVIEMLSSIIKDGSKISDLEAQLDESPKNSYKSHLKSNDLYDSSTKYNYMHYDPELHWCRMCDEFPKTAKDLLLHLQCEKHKKNVSENDVGDNTPWHKLPQEQELPSYEHAPKKRIPIRGLQFFISAPAWYCKLCDTWIGDLHCASHHLKSQAHFQNYANFVEQNPHWEIEWLKDREKAMSRRDCLHNSSDSDSDKKKRKHKNRKSSDSSSKDKKKKKRSKKRRKHSSDTSSSSSSSDSSSEEEENDKSKSIRVVMRNMKVQSIMNEDLSGKWEMLERIVDEHKKKEDMHNKQRKEASEDKLINQWMTVSEPQEKEKLLFDNLKDRMRQKQEIEKAKYAEMEKKKREKEREEKEYFERKQREEQEMRERLEREKRERDREEYERIRDKERESVKFKASRDNYRRKDSNNDNDDNRHSSSKDHHYEKSRDSYSSDRNRENGRDRSRSRSHDKDDKKSKSSTKRLPFIGRMPLFKNKKTEEKVEVKEIKKEDYDIPRRTRFQPGNLAKAFLPSPDVVCYPKLSCIPPLTVPPPPQVSQPDPPAPPKISEDKPMKPPPPPKIGSTAQEKNLKKEDNPSPSLSTQTTVVDESNGYSEQVMDATMMEQYYQSLEYGMMYSQMYDYSQCEAPQPPPMEDIPLSHTMPLQPPPLPPNDPNDDLALLGISADDMAAQTF